MASSRTVTKSTKPSSRRRPKSQSANEPLRWGDDTELVGLVFELQPLQASALHRHYAIGLHAWFLDQVRQLDPTLSTYLHDGESEKAFTLSRLEGAWDDRTLQLQPDRTYRWTVTALSQPVAQWLSIWLTQRPESLELRDAPFTINRVSLAQPATTYTALWDNDIPASRKISLSFLTPTGFHRRGHHLPLPWPTNVFQSYLRRWNNFSGYPIEQDPFLDWVDTAVFLQRHWLESTKVAAGKRGAITGFIGAVEFGLDRKAARAAPDFTRQLFTLAQLSPYCGTGHKTAFGLGQTAAGWQSQPQAAPVLSLERLQGQRIAELTEIFKQQRQRPGGNRATQTAETWATILARRELGGSLQDIAQDLDMRYETVKTYAKLARRALKQFR